MPALWSDSRRESPFRTGLLASVDTWQEKGVEAGVPLPFFEKEDLLTVVSELLYVQHGGSGMQLSYSEIMGMELSEILWWRQRLCDMRTKEAEAIKNSR